MAPQSRLGRIITVGRSSGLLVGWRFFRSMRMLPLMPLIFVQCSNVGDFGSAEMIC